MIARPFARIRAAWRALTVRRMEPVEYTLTVVAYNAHGESASASQRVAAFRRVSRLRSAWHTLTRRRVVRGVDGESYRPGRWT